MITATLDRADYDLYANNIWLGNGQIIQGVNIPPNSARFVTTSMDISYDKAGEAAWSYLMEGRVTWYISGTAHIDSPIGTLNIPFGFSRAA